MKRLHSKGQRVKNWMYMAEYKCSCTDLQDFRRDLLNYCGKHGDNLLRVHKLKYDPKLARGAAS